MAKVDRSGVASAPGTAKGPAMDITGWGTSRIPDLSGRTAMVTGANSGIGLHAAIGLAGHGARVLLGCRNRSRAEEATARCRRVATGAEPTVVEIDMSDLASVRRAGAQVAEMTDHVDILVNNAGIMAVPRMLSVDGFEMQLATNHLGHFALTASILPLLLAGDATRVVNVSSLLASRARTIALDDLQGERSYDGWGAYHQSKLANLLFTVELDRRARAAGWGLQSLVAHPGLASTRLVANGPAAWAPAASRINLQLGTRLVGQSPAHGALPLLRAATDPDAVGGTYYGPRGPAHLRGRPIVHRMPAPARDPELARRLWAASVDLTGADFGGTLVP
jgi:NAD(P)-dependent dehydrogenase (short-subunit alcohol dehydrogenase family)